MDSLPTLLLPPPEQLEALVLVLSASLLAGLIGLEREFSAKPAGFRTHMIVGGASALLILHAATLVERFEQVGEASESLRFDPIRVIEAIVVGVSFIGAGTILKVEADDRVRYLTTAASTLLSAGVGIGVALRQFHLAIGIVLTTLAITFVVGRIEHLVSRRR